MASINIVERLLQPEPSPQRELQKNVGVEKEQWKIAFGVSKYFSTMPLASFSSSKLRKPTNIVVKQREENQLLPILGMQVSLSRLQFECQPYVW